MSLLRLGRALVLPVLLAAGLAAPTRADGPCCDGCGRGIFCPRTTFCRIRPPCIKWKCVCPKPVCDPCSLDHYGYYPKCWQSWPFPPDYSCCHQPPNAVLADQLLAQPVATSATTDTLPLPRRLNGQPGLER